MPDIKNGQSLYKSMMYAICSNGTIQKINLIHSIARHLLMVSVDKLSWTELQEASLLVSQIPQQILAHTRNILVSRKLVAITQETIQHLTTVTHLSEELDNCSKGRKVLKVAILRWTRTQQLTAELPLAMSIKALVLVLQRCLTRARAFNVNYTQMREKSTSQQVLLTEDCAKPRMLFTT